MPEPTPAPLGDPIDLPAAVTPGEIEIDPLTPPASVMDLSRWYLTLPVDDPTAPRTGEHDTKPWNVYQPGLATFIHLDLFRTLPGPCVEYTAPVRGVSTHGSGATRCELRQMQGPGHDQKADWSIDDDDPHRLTCTLTCDGTSIVGREEVIVGQIHGPGGTPPLILCMNHTHSRLEVFRQGPRRQPDLLTGLAPGELFTYRIEACRGRLRVWAARGQVDQLPTTPAFDWPASVLTERSGLYFKAGAYNKQEISTATIGTAIVRHHRLDLV